MAECIERGAAINEFAIRSQFYDAEWGNKRFTPDDVETIIRSIPAADVRPVVLCRDCKYAPIGDKDGSDLEWPFNEFDENPCPYKCLDNWYSHKPAPDFFCAAGEKREES